LRQLEAASLAAPYVRLEQEIPRTVMARVPIDTGLPDLPAVQALSFLDRFHDLYSLIDVRAQLYLQRIEHGPDGSTHVFFGQRQNGIAVYGAQIAVHMARGQVMGTTGNFVPTGLMAGAAMADLGTPVDGAAAEAIALDDAGGNSRVLAPAELMYY